MNFTYKDGIVYCSADHDGQHVALFGPRGRLTFRDDLSKLGKGHPNVWAFFFGDPLVDGQSFVWASTDLTFVGEVDGNRIVPSDRRVAVTRGPHDKPLALLGHSSPTPRKKWPRAEAVDEPIVSIITATFNRPAMLRECIDSMRAQTLDAWEHLIADDGSTDQGQHAVLDAAPWMDPRVRVYRKGHVDRPAQHWNDLIDRTRGKYIGFLDDDNLKYPRFLEVLVSVLDGDPSVDMVTCGWTVIDKDGSRNECHLNLETSEAVVQERSTIDTGAFLIRREALEKIGYFPLNIRTNEDWAIMRRAVTCLKMAHLPDTLAVYRAHSDQRMERCAELGNDRDKGIVQGTVWGPAYGVRLHSALIERLTASQRDVVLGYEAALDEISWIETGSDLAVVLMPFQMDLDQARFIADKAQIVVSVHSEDPYALSANTERVRAMAQVRSNTWVATNDSGCVEAYKKVVGDRVIVCPSLSADHRALDKPTPMETRPYDAVLVGYAYPGRVAFMRDFMQRFKGKLLIVGDGWREAGFEEAMPTASFLETVDVYGLTRAVICLHRKHGDCCDGPHEPRLVARGYVEGQGGARVFVDTSRPEHPFEDGEVEWFETAKELAERLDAYLALSADEQVALAEPLRLRTHRDFTYRTRLARIVNAVRAPRPGAVIP